MVKLEQSTLFFSAHAELLHLIGLLLNALSAELINDESKSSFL